MHCNEDPVPPKININFKIFKKSNGSIMKSKKKLKILETSLLGLLAKIRCKKIPRDKYNESTHNINSKSTQMIFKNMCVMLV